MADNSINRRKFLSNIAIAGTLAILPGALFRKAYGATPASSFPDILSVKSNDFYKATLEALHGLGGMQRFVKPNARVGLLLNSSFKNRGTSTNTDIALATLKMCFDVGASEVILVKPADESYWQKSTHFESHSQYIEKLKVNEGHTLVPVPKGVTLKEAEVINSLNTFDTFINIPIAKQHGAAQLTNALKNLMGICTNKTNRGFHSAIAGAKETDNDRLAQCIADINTLRKPDLCIVDATEFILNNGPYGPGEIAEEHKVLAGTDQVALDAYCTRFHNLAVSEVKSIGFAEQHGLGSSDLSKITISELELA